MVNLDSIFKLDFNERSDGSPAWVKNCLQKQAELPLWKYPNRSALEKKIASFYQLSSEQVVVTNGADEAIQLIMLACKFDLLPFDKVLLPTPTFSMYEKGLQQWQLDYDCITPNADNSMNQQQIQKQWIESENTLLILVRPNNPTGEMLPKKFIQSLLQTAGANNNMLLLDEAYSDFADDNCEDFLSTSKNLIILKTFSKAYGLASVRTGYVLSNASVNAAIEKIAMPFNVSGLSLQLCAECFSEIAQTELKSYLKVIKRNRQRLTETLKSQKCISFKTEGNFIFVTFSQLKTDLLKNIFLKNNVFVRNFNEPTLQNSLRITVPLNIEPLIEIFNTIATPDLFCLDMDGTLIDVSESYDNAIKQTVVFFASKTITTQQIEELRDSGGFNNDWILTQQLLKQLKLNISLQQVTDKFQELYLGTDKIPGFIDNESTLISPKTLGFFKQQNIAIVTGRPRSEAIIGANSLGLECPIVSMDDVEKTKPDPESIEKAVAYSSIKNVWMIGDNVDDIQCAVQYGALAIGIGVENSKQLYQAGADIVLDNINQIQQLA